MDTPLRKLFKCSGDSVALQLGVDVKLERRYLEREMVTRHSLFCLNSMDSMLKDSLISIVTSFKVLHQRLKMLLLCLSKSV